MAEMPQLKGVDVRHVEAFLLVADELNFTRAAARLHVAQQALSTRIRQLEERLGADLFVRDTHSVRLTPAGEAFRGPAERALHELSAAVNAVEHAKRAGGGRLVVGLTSMTSLGSAQELVRGFREAHPEIEVDVRTVPWPDPSAGIVAGAVDVAVVRPPFAGDGVCLEVLRSEPRVIVLPASHALASRETLRPAEVVDEPWVHLPDTDPVFEAFWTLADHRDGPKTIGATIADFDECFMAVTAGRAIAAVPGEVGDALGPVWPALRFVPLVDCEPATVAVAWRTDRESDAVRAFVAVAKALRDGHNAAL